MEGRRVLFECKPILFEYNIFILVFCGQSLKWTKIVVLRFWTAFCAQHISTSFQIFSFWTQSIRTYNHCQSSNKKLLLFKTIRSGEGGGFDLNRRNIFKCRISTCQICCNLLLSSRDNSLKIYFCSVVQWTYSSLTLSINLFDIFDNVPKHS
jgi:hypothetical protein